MSTRASLVAVIGPGEAAPEQEEAAEAVGAGLAARGCSIVCGGLGGVMAAACRGAQTAQRSAGVTTIGLLPGHDPAAANPWVEVAIPTGLGEGRNLLVARAGRVVVAIGGAYGTLSEIALALKAGTPVVGLDTWQLSRGGEIDTGIILATDPDDAVRRTAALLRR